MFIVYRTNKELTSSPKILLTKEEMQHIKALRLKNGENLLVCDGEGTAYPSILELPYTIIKNEKEKIIDNSNQNICIMGALPSGNRFDKMIDMAVQLGISCYIPVIFQYSERKDFSIERIQKIIKQSASQSRRLKLPRIYSSITFKEIFDYTKHYKYILYADIQKKGTISILELMEIIKKNPLYTIAVIVGPEGGFSPEEKEILQNKFKCLYLNEYTLRIETAVINILSIFHFLKI